MGMYTEFVFAAELKPDVSEQVLGILRYLTNHEAVSLRQRPHTPLHLFFKCRLWEIVLIGNSHCFPGDACSTLKFDDEMEKWTITIRSNIKNYDGEIEAFLDWITPHLHAYEDKFQGYFHYEDVDVPTLIYYPNRLIVPTVPGIDS